MKKEINTESESHHKNDTHLSIALCSICHEKPIEQVHHIDENHKNNKESNLQHICTMCHAKIHGIEPRYSALRLLVTLYRRCQKARIAIENQIRGLSRIELEVPEFFSSLIKEIQQQEKLYSKQIKGLLERGNQTGNDTHERPVAKKKEGQAKETLNHQCQQAFPSYPYLKSIKGISHLLAGKLLAMINIKKTPSVASLWAYAGLTPDSKKKKGKKSNWNQELKMVCYQISDSFVKQRTPKYREIYDKEKAKQLKLLETATIEKETMVSLQSNNIEEENHGYSKEPKPIVSCSPPSSKLHAENRARRRAVKEFLKDYWVHLHNKCKEVKKKWI